MATLSEDAPFEQLPNDGVPSVLEGEAVGDAAPEPPAAAEDKAENPEETRIIHNARELELVSMLTSRSLPPLGLLELPPQVLSQARTHAGRLDPDLLSFDPSTNLPRNDKEIKLSKLKKESTDSGTVYATQFGNFLEKIAPEIYILNDFTLLNTSKLNLATAQKHLEELKVFLAKLDETSPVSGWHEDKLEDPTVPMSSLVRSALTGWKFQASERSKLAAKISARAQVDILWQADDFDPSDPWAVDDDEDELWSFEPNLAAASQFHFTPHLLETRDPEEDRRLGDPLFMTMLWSDVEQRRTERSEIRNQEVRKGRMAGKKGTRESIHTARLVWSFYIGPFTAHRDVGKVKDLLHRSFEVSKAKRDDMLDLGNATRIQFVQTGKDPDGKDLWWACCDLSIDFDQTAALVAEQSPFLESFSRSLAEATTNIPAWADKEAPIPICASWNEVNQTQGAQNLPDRLVVFKPHNVCAHCNSSCHVADRPCWYCSLPIDGDFDYANPSFELTRSDMLSWGRPLLPEFEPPPPIENADPIVSWNIAFQALQAHVKPIDDLAMGFTPILKEVEDPLALVASIGSLRYGISPWSDELFIYRQEIATEFGRVVLELVSLCSTRPYDEVLAMILAMESHDAEGPVAEVKSISDFVISKWSPFTALFANTPFHGWDAFLKEKFTDPIEQPVFVVRERAAAEAAATAKGTEPKVRGRAGAASLSRSPSTQGKGPGDKGPAGKGPAGKGPAGKGPAGQGPAAAGKGPAGKGPAGKAPEKASPAPSPAPPAVVSSPASASTPASPEDAAGRRPRPAPANKGASSKGGSSKGGPSKGSKGKAGK